MGAFRNAAVRYVTRGRFLYIPRYSLLSTKIDAAAAVDGQEPIGRTGLENINIGDEFPKVFFFWTACFSSDQASVTVADLKIRREHNFISQRAAFDPPKLFDQQDTQKGETYSFCCPEYIRRQTGGEILATGFNASRSLIEEHPSSTVVKLVYLLYSIALYFL